jgi:hypothetical protein
MASLNNIVDRLKKASKGVVDAGAKTMLKVQSFLVIIYRFSARYIFRAIIFVLFVYCVGAAMRHVYVILSLSHTPSCVVCFVT